MTWLEEEIEKKTGIKGPEATIKDLTGYGSPTQDIIDEINRAGSNIGAEYARAGENIDLAGSKIGDWWEGVENAAGDLSLGGGGAGGDGDTATNAPWAPIQPYLKDYYAQVGEWGKDPGGVAGATPETQQAWDLTSQRALQGSPLTDIAQGTMARGMMEENPALAMYDPTASGDMMDQDFNKFFQRASKGIGEQYRDVVMPSIASRFGAAGRSGSGAEKEMTERAMGQYGEMLGNIGTDIYGQERGRQMQAIGNLGSLWGQGASSRLGYAGMAPSIAGQDYADIGQLAGVGEQKRGYEQQALDQPYQNLQRQGGLLQPGLGFSEQSQPTYGNTLASAMGTGMMTYGATQNPYLAIGMGALDYYT
jgi:hypothetical protein